MKTYVVCIDGTWNSPTQKDADPIDPSRELVTDSNVLRVFRFLTGEGIRDTFLRSTARRPLNPGFSSADPDLGAVLYVPGVGTSGGFIANKWQGATGAGTLKRILGAYSFLAEHHQPGDRIFGFGFSRGAFAVRSLAGLIEHAGLPSVPRQLTLNELDDVGDSYRKGTRPTGALSSSRRAEIDFLGVWDTVGALAFGQDRFHNISSTIVRRVAHALALDEQRQQFEPEYWIRSGPGTELEEVWFSGVHSNVGGGYVNQELSNIALAWVVSRAVAAGLPAGADYVRGWYGENPFGAARDSHKEFLRLSIFGAWVKGRPNARVIRDDQSIHMSVFDRIEAVDSEYSTGGLERPDDWQPYVPAARFSNAGALPKRTDYKGRVFETPDYLPGATAQT